jgi:hypothetical protein
MIVKMLLITRSSKWIPLNLYNLIENPPFSKGDFPIDSDKFPPFDKGGIGGISTRVQVRKSHRLNAPINHQ